MENKKNVPEIRFKGFAEEWKCNALGLIAHISMGQSPDGKNYTNNPNDYILVQGNADIKNGSIVPRVWTTQITKRADVDDLIFTVRAPVGEVGKTAYKVVIGRGVAAIKGNNFVYHLLKKLNDDGYWKQYSAGSTFDSINSDTLRNIEIVLPSEGEQKTIGNFFQNIDRLINTSQAKLDKLKTIKKACLDKMFPRNGSNIPEIRFKGFTEEWATKQFGTCVLIQRGGSPRPIDEFITNDENGINWIKIGDVSSSSRYITSTKEKIKPEGESKSRRVVRGDLILSNSMSFGRPYIMQIDGCIHDGWLLIRNEKEIFDLEYLLQMLSSDYMLGQYQSLASGGVVNNLNSQLVQSTTVQIADKREQFHIGSFFKNMDDLIIKTEQKINKLKNIKKACLDKMFVNTED